MTAPPRGRFAAQSPRLLTSSPRAILGYSREELARAIRMSEGRTVVAVARVRGANVCDGVSNMELCAAFGADIIALGLYDPYDPYFPGLPNLADDASADALLAKVQIDLGRGWTLGQVRRLIGRPVAAAMYGTPDSFPDQMEASFAPVRGSVDTARLLVDQGADIVQLMDWLAPLEAVSDLLAQLRKEIGAEALISFARPNGWGLFGYEAGRDFFTVSELKTLVAAGADIIELPGVGTFPGLTVEKVGSWATAVRTSGGLVNMWIASSQEGADTGTVRTITLDCKKAGADMLTISDVWLGESVPDPENILALSVALRGRRHTYRRMAFSTQR
ncbi:MAG: hypothetical protein LBK95_09970 [Bifidobacteriaceae bacterium]|jgi:hypothetical protein|nr:hypothetical protein [Bifidobacteriaceae bacterium]